MRNNPYNKNLKACLPLSMLGPTSTTILTSTPQEAEAKLTQAMEIPRKRYRCKSTFFNTIQPPVVNKNFTVNMPNILGIEMGETEVTQALFEEVMGWNPSFFNFDGYLKPVEAVTWYDCLFFCNKLSVFLNLTPCYEITNIQKSGQRISNADIIWNEAANGFRLPTMREWTIFAKAGTENKWAGCDIWNLLPNYAWYSIPGSSLTTHNVGEKEANEWGLYDMSGNVWEWCWEQRKTYYFLEITILGGSYRSLDDQLKIKDTFSLPAGSTADEVGFRICRNNT